LINFGIQTDNLTVVSRPISDKPDPRPVLRLLSLVRGERHRWDEDAYRMQVCLADFREAVVTP